MKQISLDAAKAFAERRSFRRSNTEVRVHSWGVSLHLFGHSIACLRVRDNVLSLDNCGYRTRTTKERLNAVLRQFWPHHGCLYQRCYNWHITGDCPDITEEFFNGIKFTIPGEIDEDI